MNKSRAGRIKYRALCNHSCAEAGALKSLLQEGLVEEMSGLSRGQTT